MFETAKQWQNATNITRAITIGLGVFWGYELVRYLIAANSVLPQNARPGDLSQFELYVPPEPGDDSNDNTENKNGETEK